MDKLESMKVGDLKKIYNILEVNGHSKEWFIHELKKFFENTTPVRTTATTTTTIQPTISSSTSELTLKERRKINNRKAYLKRKNNS